ncbi:MAG: FtsX-like permease family protein [Candidatus Kapabacteria bacterium]|nr:FtsX-like permease family protein [Candidatus Kapabacteria bacterium]
MKLLLTMAWRGLWRNKRRTIITISAVAFATFLTLMSKAMNDGTYLTNIKYAVDSYTGYLQINHKGYIDNPTLKKSFIPSNEINRIIKSTPYLKSFTQRVVGDGLIAHKNNTFGVMILGVDPLAEKKVTKISDRVKEGNFVNSENKNDIVVGAKLLEKLEAKLGDTIVVLVSCFDGSMGNMKLRIGGVTKSGQAEADAGIVYMHIETAQELFALDGRISSIVISLTDFDKIKNSKEYLEKNLSKELEVSDWTRIMPELKQTMDMDSANSLIFLGILIVIVGFGILNTILMSVTERFREFGVILALGARNIKLIWVVIFETILISLIGLIVGLVIGIVLNYYVYYNPIAITGVTADMYQELGFMPAIYTTVTFDIYVYTVTYILAVCFLAVIYPIYRISKLEALKGIRFT